jgi:hypothetical protein
MELCELNINSFIKMMKSVDISIPEEVFFCMINLIGV